MGRTGVHNAPPWTDYFEEMVTEAATILLAIEMPRYPVRRAAAINARGNWPTSRGNGERQASFAVKDLNERGHPVGPRQGILR